MSIEDIMDQLTASQKKSYDQLTKQLEEVQQTMVALHPSTSIVASQQEEYSKKFF